MVISLIIRWRLIWIGFSIIGVLSTSCIVASEADCISDDDCATDEHCIRSGGLFVQDGVCVGDELQNPDIGLPIDTAEPAPPDADDTGDPVDADDTGDPVDTGDTGPADAGDTDAPDADECPVGEAQCGAQCVDLTSDIEHCGGCDQECNFSPSNASPTCTAQGCDFKCDSGYDACDGHCFSDDYYTDNVDHCGECHNSCDASPANATPVCEVDVCTFECLSGFQPCGDECIPDTELCCDPDASTDFGGGSGTANDPYTICSVEHLIGIDSQHSGDYFQLTTDLDASGFTSLEPMGHPSLGFNGVFDGAAHSIDHLTIQGSGDEIGAFSSLSSDAEIYDLTLSSVDIEGDSLVGAIAGYSEGTISNVEIDGQVQGDSEVGGVVGVTRGGELISVFTDITVDAQGDKVGGLVGASDKTSISESSARGDITSTQGEAIGGLIGELAGDEPTERVFASGNVEGQDLVGGLVGNTVDEDTLIIDSYATAEVTSSQNFAGGFLGSHTGTIERCYSAGEIVDNGNGFVGAATEHVAIFDSYLDEDTSNSDGTVSLYGTITYLSTNLIDRENSEFDDESNFDFDFDDIWEINTAPDGHQRPVLQWQDN